MIKNVSLVAASRKSAALLDLGQNGGALTRRRYKTRAFTLIELLVVISIIGVLAGLTVGLSNLASTKSKQARIKAEMNKLVNAIENYKSTIGSYPPDYQVTDPSDSTKKIGIPAPNQLYYELNGTVFNRSTRQFLLAGTQEPAPAPGNFGAAGYANAATDPKDIKFTESFKGDQFKLAQLKANQPSLQGYVLAVPVPGPAYWGMKNVKGGIINPWLYVSTSPTNNPERFDLWTEVIIGKNIVRFSNWEKDPVVVGPR
jgi:prepilin-type N-terminal cleavage/methylation domain-containing protein